MPHTIFWSWQSDRPGTVSRHFLKEVLEKALILVGEELGLDESERPGLDHDTKDEAGLVSIPESILAKIDGAAVFVADLTPVAQTDRGRWVANPNVLIELGYAKKALGPSQVILIWNDAWGGCKPDDLPFDLRHRRAPITYSLHEGASRKERERVEGPLVRIVAAAIGASLRRVRPSDQQPPGWPEAVPARSDDPSVWFDPGVTLNVNAGTSHGADRVSFNEGPRSFVKILPRDWPAGRRPGGSGDSSSFDLPPLGDQLGRCSGPTRGGVITYHASEREDENVISDTATQWFATNGQIWSFDGRIIFTDISGNRTLATTYIVECWSRFLRRAASFYAGYGVAGPFKVEIGLTGLEGLHWPKDRLFPSIQLGLEPLAQCSLEVPDLSEDQRFPILLAAHTAMLSAFGFWEDEEGLRKILAETRRP